MPTTSGRSPDVAEPGDAALDRLVGFGRFLRANGLNVGTGRIMSFVRSAAVLDSFDPVDLRLAARMTLVSRPEDFGQLDALYDRYFLQRERPPDASIVEAGPPPSHDPEAPPVQHDDERALTVASRWTGATEDEAPEGESALRIVASDAEVLRRRDFTDLTPEERRQIMVGALIHPGKTLM